MNRIVLKPIQFLLPIALICCLQVAAWATIGFAEWEVSTPGGNKIGKNDILPAEVKGVAIYNDKIFTNNRMAVYLEATLTIITLFATSSIF